MAIALIAADGHAVNLACRVREVTRAGDFAFVTRGPSARASRHAWLTSLTIQIHGASRGTHGAPRVHAELRLGRGIVVGHNAVAMLMRRARAYSVAPTAGDLVDRGFSANRTRRAVGYRHHSSIPP